MDEHGNPLPPGAPPVAPPPVTMTAEHLGALLDKIQEQNTLQANQHQLAMDALLKVQRDADKKREEWEEEREARRTAKEKEREETRKKEKAEEQIKDASNIRATLPVVKDHTNFEDFRSQLMATLAFRKKIAKNGPPTSPIDRVGIVSPTRYFPHT